MPTIETVSIDDVYPWEDEYGNQFLSRDYSTKENQRYVEELARSMRAKGIPDEMVQLSRDGGIYRIVSGNSRVRAMRMLGTTRFPAIVLDDEEAEQAVRRAVEATVRTNTKKKYEPTELSGYVQQLAMFADDQYVADAAGIEPEQVAKIRRARKVVGEDGDGYTIERMCAIAEFGEDHEALDRLTKCPEREISATVGMLRSKRERAEKERGLAAELEAMGIPVVADVAGMRAVGIVSKAENVPSDLPEGTVATRHAVPGFMALYAPASADVADEELRAQQAAADREAWREQYAKGAERRMRWMCAAIEEGKSMKALDPFVLARSQRFADASVRRFCEETGIVGIPVGVCESIAAFMELNTSDYGIHAYDGGTPERLCRKYRDLIEALETMGYEMDADEAELYEQACAVAGEEQ